MSVQCAYSTHKPQIVFLFLKWIKCCPDREWLKVRCSHYKWGLMAYRMHSIQNTMHLLLSFFKICCLFLFYNILLSSILFVFTHIEVTQVAGQLLKLWTHFTLTISTCVFIRYHQGSLLLDISQQVDAR